MLLSNYRFEKLYRETKYVQLILWCFQGRLQTCLKIPHFSFKGTKLALLWTWDGCRAVQFP